MRVCRVRFAEGSLQDVYGTPDGHPSHEGQTARQRRSLNTSYPVDLTPHSIRMLEQELGESYRLSINRLKRRHVDDITLPHYTFHTTMTHASVLSSHT